MYRTTGDLIRTRWVLGVVAVLVASMAIAFPAVASAGAPGKASGSGVAAIEHRTVGVNHRGWAYLNLNYCPPGRMCAAVHVASTTAYRWMGRAWNRVALAGGWVYVSPYSGQWRWAWTQRTGWVVVGAGRFELR